MIETYAKRLQDWVLEQAPKENRGSLAKLHKKFVAAAAQLGQDAITTSNLSLWRNGIVKERLNPRSLAQLAIVRGESPATTSAWLEGIPATGESDHPLSLSDRARITPVDRLPDLLEDIVREASLAIAIVASRLKENSKVNNQFGCLLRHWRNLPKPHWAPFNPISPEQLFREQTEPWTAAMFAEIINREYGMNQYTAKDIDDLERGIKVDLTLIRLIANLHFILDKRGQPLTDANLIDLAEGRAEVQDFQCLDSQG
jgi:hypothetical protein